MKWEIVEVNNIAQKRILFVSLGRGQMVFGSNTFNAINEGGKYKYAQILNGEENGQKIFGIKLLEKEEKNGLIISFIKDKNKNIKGMSIRNRAVLLNIFGEEAVNNKAIRYGLEKSDDVYKLTKIENTTTSKKKVAEKKTATKKPTK